MTTIGRAPFEGKRHDFDIPYVPPGWPAELIFSDNVVTLIQSNDRSPLRSLRARAIGHFGGYLEP